MRDLSAQSDVDRVREVTDLVALIGEHVALRPRGREHVGLCPFHDDHSPSLAVVTHKGNHFYKCHSCGASGDAFTFVMQYHRKEFGEALQHLADRAGITLSPRSSAEGNSGGPSRIDLRKANALAASFFQHRLRDSQSARALLAERGIDDDTATKFQIGLAPEGYSGLIEAIRSRRQDSGADLAAAAAAGLLKRRSDGSFYDAFRNRLVFPILDEMGNAIAFGGRRIDPEDNPKYLNSSESPVFRKSRTLYGINLARQSIVDAGVAIVTEGYTDVIACHQAGIENVVGTLGTALTRDHARILGRLCDTVVLVFDGDEAGQRAADRGVEVFFSAPVDVRICVLPGGADPDEVVRQPDGAQAFRDAIAAADDALAYRVNRFSGELAGAATLSGREKLLDRFLAELGELGFSEVQGVRKRWVITRLSELLGLPTHEVARAVPRRRRATSTVQPSDAGSPSPTRDAVTAPVRSVSRARRLAEQELLSVLIFDPAVAAGSVSIDDQPTTTIADLFGADDFVDDATRRIYETIAPTLAAGDFFTMPRLLSALPEESDRQVASSLYFEGQRRCGDDSEQAAEALHEAAAALFNCRQAEAWQATATASLDGLDPEHRVRALHQILERRRQVGDMAGAIGQGERSQT